MGAKSLPDQAYLLECFEYNSATGELTWRVRPLHHFGTRPAWLEFNTKFPGTTAGSINKTTGVIRITLGGKNRSIHLAHRIAWKMMTGEDTPRIDHENRNPSDNSWRNLRKATNSQNLCNTLVRSDSSTGLKGVARKGNLYRAKIGKDGRRISLGYFPTAEEAHAAYCKAAQELHGEFWNPG